MELHGDRSITIPEDVDPMPGFEDYLYEETLGFQDPDSMESITQRRKDWADILTEKEHELLIQPELKQARKAIVENPNADIQSILEGE
jgi:hypothetical protein